MKQTLTFFVMIALFISGCQSTAPTSNEPDKRLYVVPAHTPIPPTPTDAKKVALVIGNRDYEYGVLTNTLNDAQDVAGVLRTIGFEVILKTNLNQRAMDDALSEFGRRLAASGSIGWFYYSGHGARAKGENYLIPTDNGRIRDERDLGYYAIHASKVLKVMQESRNQLNIMVLDACRNNPYKSVSKAIDKGLAKMDISRSSLIAFATAPGEIAADISVNGRNGLFASHLVKKLATAPENHLRVDDMFMQISDAVMRESGGRQEPWQLDSLKRPFCFGVGGCQTVAQVVVPPTPTPVVPPKPRPAPVVVPEPPPVVEPPPVPVSGVFRDRLEDGGQGPEMVWIPAGRFKMGDLQGGGSSDEQPVHEVSVQRFAIGTHEVTFAEYDKFAQKTSRQKPADEGWGRGNRPVINVSWEDATAYAAWLSQQTGHPYRLPTEAEWEYSARAGTTTKYWWGNTASHEYANYGKDECCGGLATGKDRWEYTAPVGSFAANAFGLYDTAGNVWEWTCSEYEDKYAGKESRCISSKSGGLRALRGGAWYDRPRGVRSADRYGSGHDYRLTYVGFRLARLF